MLLNIVLYTSFILFDGILKSNALELHIAFNTYNSLKITALLHLF